MVKGRNAIRFSAVVSLRTLTDLVAVLAGGGAMIIPGLLLKGVRSSIRIVQHQTDFTEPGDIGFNARRIAGGYRTVVVGLSLKRCRSLL
ncbi:Uncharacterised protein [Mycobacteroides abscessus subsp. abscessus]|nr:hypothetical protein [Mycobacteroides abscessus]SIC22059.1 Uncharacterised protein [Mycobacteroides abscessus subsp. abscessus]